jgi:hypothetical protein
MMTDTLAKSRRAIVLALLVFLPPPALRADTITIVADRDTSIFKDLPNNSAGADQSMFIGTTRSSSPRRALIDFDIAGSIPAGAIITSVRLTLFEEQSAPGETRARPIELHRLLADWGEGTTGQGQNTKTGRGFPTPPDGTTATWTSRFYNSVPWSTPGGDFLAASSGSTLVGTARQAYVWDSTASMVSDVQSWLDDPTSNFGWLLLGDESAALTARRFDTREATNSALRPMLEITYSGSAVAEPHALTLLAVGGLGIVGYVWRRKRATRG